MKELQKKIERQYVLSDSSVNEYGFRLLTAGYQMESFLKNPIGYYMHRREDGIALKWEDVHVADDKIVGTPVINLANGRGAQTCDEAENGFLNAASVGHIVVLEYSTDAEMMLPGQTGPTITKWYNKECSLVDIPGNCNALTCLYDAQENVLNLVDMNSKRQPMQLPQHGALTTLSELLATSDAEETTVITAVQDLVARSTTLTEAQTTLTAANTTLQEQVAQLNSERNSRMVQQLLDRALEDRKVTVALRNQLASDYAENPEGLRTLVATMPAYRAITEQLRQQHDEQEAGWQWDDYEKQDPTGNKLKALRADDPARYKTLFDAKFNG